MKPMSDPSERRVLLYDSAQLDAVMCRMAQHAASILRASGPVAVVGVLRRGAPLADHLTRRMVKNQGLAPPLRLDLSVKRYSDNLELLFPDTQLTEAPQHAALDLSGHTVLVVDDVLFSGHSALKVVDWLARKRPAAVRLAVLVDRCVTALPISADVVGLRLEVAPTDIVECHVPPYEPDFSVQLLRPGPQGRTDEKELPHVQRP
jgi:pyrimidine operon attenuation protein/uracil phosphoribosyltransferase